ncbi:CHAT domain-containing protein [Aureitalea sp. L0-47]|uniref:CHAT domain-containing protein n=1 Tax=Aureitalea sp. L0-47 TaxID=2816962 RepID=UPI002238EB01|nr:CHAT domain-containing protein [Aureitalea sp. L0-47]MCW5518627.1 CHAT domain-containing protein [Aureitalea sp. L0-47]
MRLLIISFLMLSGISFGQKDSLSDYEKLEVLIDENKLTEARTELKTQLDRFRSEKNYDTLVRYIKFAGSLTLAENNSAEAIKNAEDLISELELQKDPYINKEAYLELAYIYNDAGQPRKAYEIIEDAYSEASKISDPARAHLADIEYELGYYSSGYGDYPASKRHYLNALDHLQNGEKKDLTLMQQTYNALGGVMWYTSKMDSAGYYFKKSLGVLKQLDSTDLMNAYYRPALVNLNIAVISNALGKNDEAISYSESTIRNFQEFIKRSKDEQRVLQAKKTMSMATDNLGAFHNAVGEFNKAKQLIAYSFREKEKIYEPEDRNLIISRIILGQAHMSLQEFEEAKEYLQQAVDLTKDNPSIQLYWKAAALTNLASAYEKIGDSEMASRYFEEGEALYRSSLGGEFSNDFLEEFIVMSQFYAENGNTQKALSLAEESYNYTRESDFKNTLIEFKQALNLANVHYKTGDYENALNYATEALNIKLNASEEGQSISDSISQQFNKPMALLIQAEARYKMAETYDEKLLLELANSIDTGLEILEQRKTIITSYDDLSLLINENNDLFNFAKKLRLHLYSETEDEAYLNDAVGLHESAIYNRIRSRLNLRNNITFKDVSNSVLTRERELKSTLSKSLDGDGTSEINNYFNIAEQWKVFQDSLRQSHPDYFKMRYATLEEPVDNALQNIPQETTLIRYFFVEDELYAYLMNPQSKKLFSLDFEPVKDHIQKLSGDNFDPGYCGPLLHDLYNALWKPLSENITTNRVLIIPDRELFNLSFEMLTPELITTFSEFSENSLLALHSIHYNFSLLLTDSEGDGDDYGKNFVAFAPEFSQQMKEEYKLAVSDSTQLDKNYLTLLPQPFSAELVKQYSSLLSGTSFLNEQASKQVFTSNAGEYKIIHIGTHAESNNVSPELSRLIFAKNISEKNKLDDNSLYTYEIYNYDLSSDLAILTACETGKPTYQAGEGMISLAHAFTYAGSESILTSLWKIDEKSSNEILGYFYENLKEGVPKDEALRQAKLTYLSTAQGRTLAPQYWSGLVLMGDPQPIVLHSEFPFWPWFIGGLLLLIAILLIFRRRQAA